jgi:hypothetical protein
MHGFPSLHANMHRHLAVEPCLRPLGGPFILDGQSQFRLAASSRMKVQNTKLLKLLNVINIHLLRLIV